MRTYADIKRRPNMAGEGTKVSGFFKKGLDYVKSNRKPLAIGGGSGLVVGSLITLAIDKIKGKKGKK